MAFGNPMTTALQIVTVISYFLTGLYFLRARWDLTDARLAMERAKTRGGS